MRTYEEISAILVALDDQTFDKLMQWFDRYTFGECPKARVNYWLAKVGITLDELWLWECM